MQGNIIEIQENVIVVKLSGDTSNLGNLVNTYIAFQDTKTIIGELH